AFRGKQTEFNIEIGPNFPSSTPQFIITSALGGTYGENYDFGKIQAGGSLTVTGSNLAGLTKGDFDLLDTSTGSRYFILDAVTASYSAVIIPVPLYQVAGGYQLRYIGGTTPMVLGNLTVPASVPTKLAETNVTTLGFTATWEGVATSTSGYEVEIADNSVFSGSTIKTNVFVTNATITGLNPSTSSWWYRVKVSGSGNYSTNKAVSNSGLFGNAVTLDGSSQNFQSASTVSPQAGSYTIAFWMKADSLSTIQQVVRQGLNSVSGTANVDMDLKTDGSITLGQKNASTSAWQVTTGTGAIQAGVWYHIALVRDVAAPAMAIYINGSNRTAASGGSYANLGTTANSLAFGASPDALNGTSGSRFKGQIDDVRIYSRARSTSEILADLSRPLSDTEANSDATLIFYTKLDGSSFIAVKGAFNTSPTPPSGSFSPGRSPGAWDFASGDYSLRNDGSSLLLELGGLEGTTLYDQIFVRNGASTLDGIVNLMFYGSYTGPLSGSWHTFDLIWAQNGIVFGDNYQLAFNQPGFAVDTTVVEKDGGQLWQVTVRQAASAEEIAHAAALAKPVLGLAQSPGPGGAVEMFYTYNRTTGGAYLNGQYVVGGVRYEVQVSTNLAFWSNAVVQPVSATPAGEGKENATVKVISESTKAFLRLKVSN
ncbi:MAG: LamG domain-containing protein, partial [Verrucomicrobia bacterium]|nr:LamG domain-containing protein [Verrucomicrobiota bacterium]